jgi:magnesium-protoporphyrin IX monomethyl ester (oxidative) cyclase
VPQVYQPIEIAYVAALLEKKHKVHVIDAPTEGWRNIKQIDKSRYRVGLENKDISLKIKRWSPDIVEITVPFSGWSKTAFETASIVKEIDKDIITIMDGVHPSARPFECLANPNIDFVVIGEAEKTMCELADALERGADCEDLEKIHGIGFKEREEKVITEPRQPIEDLDSLPFPARHLFKMDMYFDAVKHNPLFGEVKKPWATMITSRGCPYECIFCSIHIIRGRKWRYRSPENVVSEIEHLINNYGVKQILFNDDNMTLDKNRMKAICDLIVNKKLDIEWYTPNGIRADTLDETLLIKMKKSGCKRIYIAPESGAQHVIDKITRKRLNLKDVEKAVFLSHKVGIKVSCFFILGLIGETKEDMLSTIRYAYKLKQLGADRFYFSYAMPLYGTELYEQAKKGGFLSQDFNDETLSKVEPVIETAEFKKQDLYELCEQANLINYSFSWSKAANILKNPQNLMSILIEIIRKKQKYNYNVKSLRFK